MAGLIDAAEVFPDDARALIVELGCQWTSGVVRLRALQLLSASDRDHAFSLASGDPNQLVRRWANRLELRADRMGDADPAVASAVATDVSASEQLAMFG
jgi:hypothetical protein